MSISPGRMWRKRFSHVREVPTYNSFIAGTPGPIQLTVKWNQNERIPRKLPVTFKDNYSLNATVESRFRDLKHVTNSIECTFNLEQRFFKQKQFRFRDLWRVRAFTLGGIRFNDLFRFPVRKWQLQIASPGNISTGIVHPIDTPNPNLQPRVYKGLAEPVVSPIDISNYPGDGQIGLPGITFRVGLNPSGRVQCQCQIEFRDLNHTHNSVSIQWNLVERYAMQKPLLFNVYNSVVNSTIMEWNIGAWVPSHIRQTAQVRTDFAY